MPKEILPTQSCSDETAAIRSAGHSVHRWWCLVGASLLMATKFLAAGTPLPNFDNRLDRGVVAAAKVVSSAQAKVEAQLRCRVSQLSVDRDELFGSPKFIASTRTFLTGPNGSGGAVAAATATAFPTDEPYRGIKTFLTEHQALFGFGPEALAAAKVNRDYVSAFSGFSTTVWQQHVDGIEVFEAVFKAHLTKNGELINVSSQFVPDLQTAAGKVAARATLEATPPISAQQAITLAAQNIGDILTTNQLTVQDSPQGSEQFQHFRGSPVLNNNSARLTWLPVDATTLRLCWKANIESRARGELYQILVDAQTGEIWLRDCLTDYLSDITMNVWTGESPSPMSPALASVSTIQPPVVPRTLVTLSALDTNASPAGWINDGGNTTAGNNVDAHLDWNNNNTNRASPGTAPTGLPNRVFDFPVNLTQPPFTYSNAAVVSLFYWNNWAHDKFYEYGFTEAAGNFQANNFGRGGTSGDPVQADSQDSYSAGNYNNANFSTPADGVPPRMQMYIFADARTNRDGDLDAGVMLHEYTHGVSGRLVGGGSLISALQTSGMGEGWSDFCALSLLSNPTNNPDANYTFGSYVIYNWASDTNFNGGLTNNYYFGWRRYPYSINTNINPLTYKDIDTNKISSHSGVPMNPIYVRVNPPANEVHNMGEVWCVTLWEARSQMCHKYGNAAGNQMMLQLVIDGMMLAPPNPTFLQARNAILQADLNYGGGADMDLLWAAFAKRGMGLSATSPANSTTTGVSEAFDTPPDTNAPVIAVASPANNSFLSSFTNISGTAYDGGSGLQNNQIHFTLNNNGNFWSGSYWTNTSASDPSILLTANVVNGVWNFNNVPTGGNQLQGTYYISAFARDNAGNVSQAQSGVTSTTFSIVTTPPSVAISYPPNGSTITNKLFGNNWFQGTASAGYGASVTINLFIRRNSDNLYWTGSGWGDVTNGFISNSYDANSHTWQSTGTLPSPGSGLANGTYHFIAVAVDAAGNQQQVDSVVTVDYHPVYVFNYGSQFGPTPNMNWDSPDNWDVGSEPTPDARVVINGYSPTIPGVLGVVQVYGLDMSGGDLYMSGMLIQKLNFSGGEIHGGALTLTNNGTSVWGGGRLNATALTVLGGSTLTITNDVYHDLPNCSLTNYGSVVWSSGTIRGGGVVPGTLVYNYGLWDVRGDSAWEFNTYQGNGTTFNNYGTFRKSIGTNNSQTLFPNGVYLNQLGGVLDVQQGTFRLEGSASFVGGYTTTNTTGTVLLASGNYNLNGTVTSTNFVENGGNLVGNNVIQGALTWLGGVWNGATVTVTTNSTAYISGSGNMDMANTTLTNNGTVVWSSGLIRGGSVPGTLVYNNALWDVRGDLAWEFNTYQGNGTVFNNYGTFRKSVGANGSQTLFPGGVYLNQWSGVLDVQQGTFSLQGGASFNGGYVTTNTTGTVLLAGGGYNLNGTVTGTNVVQNGGNLVGANFIRGALTWLGGIWNGANVTVTTNSTAYISGSGNMDLANTIVTNNGTVVWSSGLIRGGAASPGTFIYNHALWDVRGDLAWEFNTYQGNGTVFNNYATLRKSVGTNGSQTLFPGGVFLNQLAGVLDVQQGKFTLQGGASFTGGYTTTNTTGTLLLAGGAYSLYGTVTSTNVVENGGNLVGNNIIRGALTWLDGIWNGATVTVTTNSTVYIAGSGYMDMANTTLTNNGTVVWSSGLIRGGSVPGTLVYNNALWDVRGDLAWEFNSYQGNGTVFNNYGTFRKSVGANGSQTLFPGGVYLNQWGGVLDVQQGTFSLQGGASFTGGYTTTNTTGTLLLAAGGYNLNGTATGSNVVENGGSLVGTNVVRGALTWLGGIWNGANVTVTTNSTIYIAGSGNMDLANTTVTNNGTVVWSSGLIRGGSIPGTLVYNNALWDVRGDLAWEFSAYQGNGTVFNNYGTLRKSVGTNSSQTLFPNGVYLNQLGGVLDVQRGNFSLQGGANFAGGYVTTNNTGTAILSGGGFTLSGGLTSSNVVENGGVPVGNNVIRGALTWLSGSWNNSAMTVASNSTFYMAGAGNLDVANATLTNNGTVLWSSGYFQGGGASPGTFVYNNGLWDVQCDQVWNFNAYQGNGTTFNNNGTLRKSAGTNTSQTLFTGGVYLNQSSGVLDVQRGNFNLQGGANFAGGFVTTNNTGTTILSGGGFTMSGGLTSSNVVENGGVPVGNNVIRGALTWLSGNWNGATMTVASNSTFYMAGAGNLDVANATLTNNGTVLWSSGYFQGGGASPGTFVYNNGLWDAQCDQVWNYNAYQGNGTTFNNYGTFRKEGSVGTTTFTPGANFNSPGTVDLRSGTMALNGAVYVSPTSRLNLVIGGPSAGTQFGSESFGYPPPFDGTLAVVLTNGYVPTNGQSFTIASYPSRTGQFAATQLPPLPVISKWQLTYNPNSLLLQVVPATAFQSETWTNGNYRFVFSGQPGSSCLIEVSTNLLNWKPLLTNTPFNGVLQYVDPQTPQFPRRFYRATIFP